MKLFSINNIEQKKQNSQKPSYKQNYKTFLPSFTAMKKSDFSGIDLFVVEKEKSPIEKFDTNKDFQYWAKLKLLDTFNKDYIGRKPETKNLRFDILQEWMKFFAKGELVGFSPAIQLMAMNSITSDLKKNEDKLPPSFNREAFIQTVEEINTRLEKNPKDKFSFNQIYRKNLLITLGIKDKSNPTAPQWLYIPSKKHDSEHYLDNIKKLNAVSDLWWCTAYNNGAALYLKDKDMHIYIENFKPKVAIATDGNNVLWELQSKWNNHVPPMEYMEDVVYPYIKEHNIDIDKSYYKFKDVETGYKHQIEKFHHEIDKNNIASILNYMGIKAEKDEKDGLYIISHYGMEKATDNALYFQHFEDFGIEENDLFKYIKEIKGYANFQDTNVTDLGNLKRIGGNAIFNESKIKNLGQLEYIGGNASFKESLVIDLANLKEIKRNAEFENSIIKTLGKLRKIGGNANFNKSYVQSLENLEYVGELLILGNSHVVDIGNLKTIGLGLIGNIDGKPLRHCSNLKYIGECGALICNEHDYKYIKSITKGKTTLLPARKDT